MTSPVIEVQDLTKVYSGGTRAVDGITFSIQPGELFGFLGPNGAGKTTTIRILATLLRATSGIARVAGLDVGTHPADVRRRLGLAMQTPTLDTFATGRVVVDGSPAQLKAGIGADTVTLQLDAHGPEDLARQQTNVRDQLHGFEPLEAVTPESFGVSLSIRGAGRALPDLMRSLDRNGDGVRIVGLAVSQPTLDDVFLKYTGRRIRTEAADQPIILGW